MSDKCKTCKLRFSAQNWCSGCEELHPGLDSFDFYQPIKHTILMVSTVDQSSTTYKEVRGCERKDGKIVLDLGNGDTATYADDGSWLMFDLTPTVGWNEAAGFVPEPIDKRQVKIDLVRHRTWEHSTWVNDLYLVMDADRFNSKGAHYWDRPDHVEKELRQIAQAWLQTKAGWKANVLSSLDFNWGDFINELPISLPSIKLGFEPAERMAINAAVSFAVDQDELLPPECVLVDLLRKDGTKFGVGAVNFRNGLVFSVNSDQVMPKFDEPITIKAGSESFPAKWDNEAKRYFLCQD